jgi:hypothetical protein
MSRTRASLRPYRELKSMYDAEGVTLVDFEATKSGHIRVRCEYKGHKFFVTCGGSPSCPRAMLNHRGNLRRIIRAIDEGSYRQ